MVALAHVWLLLTDPPSLLLLCMSMLSNSIRISLPTSFRQLQHHQQQQQQVMWMTEQILRARGCVGIDYDDDDSSVISAFLSLPLLFSEIVPHNLEQAGFKCTQWSVWYRCTTIHTHIRGRLAVKTNQTKYAHTNTLKRLLRISKFIWVCFEFQFNNNKYY